MLRYLQNKFAHLHFRVLGQLLNGDERADPHVDGGVGHPLDALEDVGHRREEPGDAVDHDGRVGEGVDDLVGHGVLPQGCHPGPTFPPSLSPSSEQRGRRLVGCGC